MRDVAERATVHQCRPTLERLDEVRVDRVPEEQCHRAVRLEIAGADGGLVSPQSDDDAGQPRFEIFDSRRQGENRHDLRAGDDDESLFAGRTAVHPAQPHDDAAQGAVVHVDRARPHDAARVDAEGVAVMQLRVEHRRQQVVRARDCVEVAGKVQVDVFHRDDLRISAAGRAALHAEHRTERRLAHRQDRVLAEAPQRLGDAHGDRGLAFTRRGGRDPGDQDEPPLGGALPQRAQRNLRLELPIQLELVVRQAELGRDVANGPQLRGLCDGDIRGDFGGGCSHNEESIRAPKQRRAFSLVRRVSSSKLSPRSAAARSATARTKPGSLRLPRCGTGAR